MGADYYHEAASTETIDPSDEPGKLEYVFKVYSEDGRLIRKKSIEMEVPVGGSVYIDRLPERPPIWDR